MRANRSAETPTLSGDTSVKTGDFFMDLVWAEIPDVRTIRRIAINKVFFIFCIF
jgi:hypothetical protein